MKTCENRLDVPEVVLATHVFMELSLYQGWYNWRRAGDVASNFITVKGGRDRLDRSVHLTDGPNLLARPYFAVMAVGQHL